MSKEKRENRPSAPPGMRAPTLKSLALTMSSRLLSPPARSERTTVTKLTPMTPTGLNSAGTYLTPFRPNRRPGKFIGPHSIWVPSFLARLKTKLIPFWPPPPTMLRTLMLGLPGMWSLNVLEKRCAWRLSPPPAPAGTINSMVLPEKSCAPAGIPPIANPRPARPASNSVEPLCILPLPVP